VDRRFKERRGEDRRKTPDRRRNRVKPPASDHPPVPGSPASGGPPVPGPEDQEAGWAPGDDGSLS
jgi:hypothetical protein